MQGWPDLTSSIGLLEPDTVQHRRSENAHIRSRPDDIEYRTPTRRVLRAEESLARNACLERSFFADSTTLTRLHLDTPKVKGEKRPRKATQSLC